MHGGKSPGAPKGYSNARKHGRYSAETIRNLRYVQAMSRLALQTLQTMTRQCGSACESSPVDMTPIDAL